MAGAHFRAGVRLALLGKGVASKRGKYSVEPEAHKGRMEAIHNVCVVWLYCVCTINDEGTFRQPRKWRRGKI